MKFNLKIRKFRKKSREIVGLSKFECNSVFSTTKLCRLSVRLRLSNLINHFSKQVLFLERSPFLELVKPVYYLLHITVSFLISKLPIPIAFPFYLSLFPFQYFDREILSVDVVFRVSFLHFEINLKVSQGGVPTTYQDLTIKWNFDAR